MARLIAYQSGNWTEATTWKVSATGTNASLTNLSSSGSNTTTSYVSLNPFTVTNTEVLEGLLLHCKRVNTTGTVSVALSDDNGTTATREVTVNASDLPVEPSWVFFKFASTLTSDGGTDYKVMVKGSSAANAQFWQDASVASWARVIRTSTTATAAASDVTYIADELTGAGTKNDVEVTMDSTSLTTAYGEANVGHGGVLAYGTSASTAYKLKLAGNLNIWGGGTLNIGTAATSIPSTSSAELEFACSTNVQYGVEARAGAVVSIYGATKSNTKVLLTANAAAAQKVIKVESTSGWAVGDIVGIGSTTKTQGEGEKGTVSTIDSATQATLSANLTYAHGGIAPYVGEVVNLTRNVKVRGASQTLCAYINCAGTSSFTASYAEFYWLGSNTTNKRGINADTGATGTFSISFCSIYDFFATNPIAINTTGASGSPVIEDCVWFFAVNAPIMTIEATSGTPSIQRNWAVSPASGSANRVLLNDVGGTFQDNRLAGCGLSLQEAATIGTIKNNVVHSFVTRGLEATNQSGVIEGVTAWRNNNYGFYISTGGDLTFLSCTAYENGFSNIYFTNAYRDWRVRFVSCTFNGGSSPYNSAYALDGDCGFVLCDSCTFGNTATHSSGIVAAYNSFSVLLRKCIVTGTEVANQSNLREGPFFSSSVRFDKYNNTAGSHRIYKRYGRTDADQATYKTAAPSEALLPNNASGKLPSGSKKFAVASGTTATVTVYAYKSATYNGNQPRLVLKANSVAGISSDTVLATASGSTGSWLTLSGTTATVADNCVLEVYVDCDGTAGTVYVDDWAIS